MSNELLGLGVKRRKELDFCPYCGCATMMEIDGKLECIKPKCKEQMLRDGN